MPHLPEPEWEEWEDPEEPVTLYVELTPAPEVVAWLYGPNGEVLSAMVDRPPVTGFAQWLYRDEPPSWGIEVTWPEDDDDGG